MRKIIIILFLFQASFTFAQQNDSGFGNKILDQIATRNVYESNRIGFRGLPSKQLILMDSLIANCSSEFLLNNTINHKNAVVRVYCYKALLLKNFPIPQYLKDQFSNDASEVLILSGCLMDQKSVMKFYKETYLH